MFRSFGLDKADSEDLESGEGPVDDVLEVWFAGCHSGVYIHPPPLISELFRADRWVKINDSTDVGGGAVRNDTPHSLASITLRWMVREIVKSGCGIQFDEAALERANINVESVNSIAQDDQDALSPIHDQLKLDPLWWILEIVPLTFTWQDNAGAWHRNFRCVLQR